MKKILLLFLMLCFALPSLAKEFSDVVEIRETAFKNNTSFSTNYGNIEYYGDFLIKGLWADKSKSSKDVFLEEIYCKAYTKFCTSSTSVTNYIGYPNLQPLVDTFLNFYEIIEQNKYKYKLYSTTTGYTIEVDLLNKTASKYKVFDNGDVNHYYLISDVKQANIYSKNLLK